MGPGFLHSYLVVAGRRYELIAWAERREGPTWDMSGLSSDILPVQFTFTLHPVQLYIYGNRDDHAQ